jgi:(2Fe-2S) ferredoxin
MSRFTRHIFICTNERPAGHPKGCCKEKGSETLVADFKAALAERGLAKHIRANKAGCLDACEFGASMVVYPDGIWYGHVTRADVAEIVEKHLVGGEPVERLRIYKDKTAE